MISFKIYVSTALCCLLALPFVKAQDLKMPKTVSPFDKWDVGLRGGAGFSVAPQKSQMFIFSPNTGSYQTIDVTPLPFKELYLGGYLTRNFNPRWSLRSELSILSNNYNGTAVTVGLFPRYNLNKWFSLEAGVEAHHTVSGWSRNQYRAYIGGAVKVGDVEFNLRFSPNYHKPTTFTCGGWTNILQTGMSVNLSKLSKRMNREK